MRALSQVHSEGPCSSHIAQFHGVSIQNWHLPNASHVPRMLLGGVVGSTAGLPPWRRLSKCITLPVREYIHLDSPCKARYRECQWERLTDREEVSLDLVLEESMGFGLSEKSNTQGPQIGNGLVRQKTSKHGSEFRAPITVCPHVSPHMSDPQCPSRYVAHGEEIKMTDRQQAADSEGPGRASEGQHAAL